MNYYLIIGNLKEDAIFDDKFKRILDEHLNYYENETSLGNLILSGQKKAEEKLLYIEEMKLKIFVTMTLFI